MQLDGLRRMVSPLPPPSSPYPSPSSVVSIGVCLTGWAKCCINWCAAGPPKARKLASSDLPTLSIECSTDLIQSLFSRLADAGSPSSRTMVSTGDGSHAKMHSFKIKTNFALWFGVQPKDPATISPHGSHGSSCCGTGRLCLINRALIASGPKSDKQANWLPGSHAKTKEQNTWGRQRKHGYEYVCHWCRQGACGNAGVHVHQW